MITSYNIFISIFFIIKKRKTFNESFIKLVREVAVPFLQVDHLYRFFSSAQNDEEKFQRKIDFLRGIMQVNF